MSRVAVKITSESINLSYYIILVHLHLLKLEISVSQSVILLERKPSLLGYIN